MQYYSNVLGDTMFYLQEAYIEINNLEITSDNFNWRTMKKLKNIKYKLITAEGQLYGIGDYFDYSDKDLSMAGFKYGEDYIRGYIYTIEEWEHALEEKSTNEVPTMEDITLFKEDLKNMIDKLNNRLFKGREGSMHYIVIDDLTYDEFHNIFEELIKETKNEDIKKYVHQLL